MTTSPEPLIDFNSGGSDEDETNKYSSCPPIRPRGGDEQANKRSSCPPIRSRGRPPPPPPSSAKPKLLVRSNTTTPTIDKPVIKNSSPTNTRKPSLPPKPKNRNSAVLTSATSLVIEDKATPSPQTSSNTKQPPPPLKPKIQPKNSIVAHELSPQRSMRASDSPISPLPGNNDLVFVRQTPTTENDNRQLHINGEGLLIDLNKKETEPSHRKISQSHSSSSDGRSTTVYRNAQPVCLPRLSTREFEYEEREHSKSVFKQLHSLMKKEELCDAVLIAGDKEIKAHRIVLSANSRYFQDMFIGEFSEPENVPVVIEEVDEDSLTAMVEFAYTSHIKLTESNVYKLFEAADILHFQGVKNACFRFFKSQMNKSNCIRTWIFAESHNCTELLQAALRFIEVNFLDIVRGNEFLNVEAETISAIVCLEDIAITFEEQVYDAVINWLNHNRDQRLPYSYEVLKNVRFPSMNKDYLMHIVDNEKIIQDNPDCLNLLIQALQSHVSSERATLKRKLKSQGSKYLPRSASMAVEEVELPKGEMSLGVAIMGGSDRPTHVFRQGDKPGIFIREVISGGAAAKTGKMKTGDRILSINGTDTSNCPHEAAIRLLLTPKDSLKLLVRHEPPPKGLKEITLVCKPGCGFGFSIGGGVNGEPVNPFDETDEGIFVTQIIPGGASEQDGRLSVGTRILQVNSISLLGKTLDEALKILHEIIDRMCLLVCQGFDPSSTPGHSESGSITSWGDEAMSSEIEQPPKDWNHIYDQPPV